MRIDKIHIKNFKCFEDSTFELNPHFTVIIGDNGKGKTAICDALAAVLGQVVLGDSQKAPNNRDIRIVKIDGQPKPQTPLAINSWGNMDSVYYNWGLEINLATSSDLFGNISEVATTHHNSKRIRLAFELKIQESRKKSGVIFPLIAYYGTGRLWGKVKNAVPYQKQEEGIMHAYPDCLIPNTTSAAFVAWYKTLVAEIQQFNRKRDEILLSVVNKAITSMIPEWEDMAFSFLEDDIVGTLYNEERFFKQLSDGYRNTIGMVADMIYRCIQLNPHFGENVLKETPGIVLIDELDLHLHPNWQRHIVADLKRIFPKVQFVATTHSPFIVQSLRTEELINLDTSVEGLEDDPLKYSLEEVADSEMGIEQKRSEKFLEMQAEAAAFFQLIKNKADKADIAKAKAKLDELRILFNHDPAYVALLESELPKD